MMENETNATAQIEQKIRLIVEENYKSAGTSKQLETIQKHLRKLEKHLSKYTKLWNTQAKAQKAQLKIGAQYLKQQQKLNQSIRKSLQPLKQQVNLISKSRKEMTLATRASQSLGRSLRNIGGMLGVAGLGYLAISRIQKVMDSRLTLAVTGGAQQIKLIKQLTQGRNTTSAIDLAAKFQGQSPYSRFALGDQSLKGLVNLQKQMEPIGLDLANDLILGVTKSLEPAKLQQMLKVAAGGNIKQALLGAASGGNVGAVTSALNALEIGNLAGENKLDPMLQAATEFKTTGNRLADAFDKLGDNIVKDLLPTIQSLTSILEKMAGTAGNLSTKELIGYGLGGYLGYKGIKGIGKYTLRNMLQPGGRGMPGSMPSSGRGIPNTKMLPRLGPNGYPVISPLHLPAGGAVGVGLAGGAAAGGVYTAIKSGQTAYTERQALRAIEKTQNDVRLFKIANQLKSTADTELSKLKAKRMELDAMISTSAPSGDMGIKQGWVGKTLGFYGDFPQADSKQIERLRKQRLELHKQIEMLEKQKQKSGTSNVVSGIFDSLKTGIDKVKTSAEKLRTGLDYLAVKGLEQNLRKLQQQAARQEQLQLTANEKTSLTQLARLSAQIAQTTPLGSIGALPEMRELQNTLETEIGSLRKVLVNIDESTFKGRLEANGIRANIKSLQLEQRQNSLSITRAIQDSLVSQAFNSGKFEKILINWDKNLGQGLRIGAVNPRIPEFTGSTTSSGRKPVRFDLHKATNHAEALEILAKAARQAAEYSAEDQNNEQRWDNRSGYPTKKARILN